MCTVRLFTREHTVGVVTVVVVVPALWVMLREMSGLPKVALVKVAKVMVVVGRVTA
jgi:hypothetical protein